MRFLTKTWLKIEIIEEDNDEIPEELQPFLGKIVIKVDTTIIPKDKIRKLRKGWRYECWKDGSEGLEYKKIWFFYDFWEFFRSFCEKIKRLLRNK